MENEEDKLLRRLKIKNDLLLIITVILSIITILFVIIMVYSINNASASIKTSCTVPELLTAENSESFKSKNEIIWYKL